jgi:hypothetical protein
MARDYLPVELQETHEQDPAIRRKSWIHTLLKATVYNTLDNTLMVIGYTMGDKWYEKPSDCGSPTLRKIWRVYLLGWQRIAKREGWDINAPQKSKMHIHMNKCMQIAMTIVDVDPAWLRRVDDWMHVWEERRNDRYLEAKECDIEKQN